MLPEAFRHEVPLWYGDDPGELELDDVAGVLEQRHRLAQLHSLHQDTIFRSREKGSYRGFRQFVFVYFYPRYYTITLVW